MFWDSTTLLGLRSLLKVKKQEVQQETNSWVDLVVASREERSEKGLAVIFNWFQLILWVTWARVAGSLWYIDTLFGEIEVDVVEVSEIVCFGEFLMFCFRESNRLKTDSAFSWPQILNITKMITHLPFEDEVVFFNSVVVTAHTKHITSVAFGYDDVDGLVVVEDNSYSCRIMLGWKRLPKYCCFDNCNFVCKHK